MSASRPTPETDQHQNAMNKKDFDVEMAKTYTLARKLECERDEAREALSGRTVSCSLCNEAARKIEDMHTVIQEAHKAFKNLIDLTPNVPPWANTEATVALAKLQPYLRP